MSPSLISSFEPTTRLKKGSIRYEVVSCCSGSKAYVPMYLVVSSPPNLTPAFLPSCSTTSSSASPASSVGFHYVSLWRPLPLEKLWKAVFRGIAIFLIGPSSCFRVASIYHDGCLLPSKQQAGDKAGKQDMISCKRNAMGLSMTRCHRLAYRLFSLLTHTCPLFFRASSWLFAFRFLARYSWLCDTRCVHQRHCLCCSPLQYSMCKCRPPRLPMSNRMCPQVHQYQVIIAALCGHKFTTVLPLISW